MSYETLLYVSDAFSFFLFLVVLLSSLQSKATLKRNVKLILVSTSMFLAMFLFFREQYLLSIGRQSILLTYFTYSFAAFSNMLIVSMIVTLYTKVVLSRKMNILIVAYGFIVGLIMAINVVVGSFLSTHILLGFIYMIPLVHLVVYLVKYDKHFYINVFFIQTIVLLIAYVMKTINIIIHFDTISFTSVNYNHIGLLFVSNVILYLFIISYLIVQNSMIMKELEAHKHIVEASLSKAITLSETDALTNLFNRRKIIEIIENYFELNQYNHQVFSVVMIDIDDFKQINDSYGHNTGDEVLKFVSSTLTSLLREGDYICRWGGDEFLVLLPNVNKEDAQKVMNKVVHHFKINQCEAVNQVIEISYGIEDSKQHRTLDTLIHQADEMMYLKKNK